MNRLILCFIILTIAFSSQTYADKDRKGHFRHHDSYEKHHYNRHKKEQAYFRHHKRPAYYGSRHPGNHREKHGYKHHFRHHHPVAATHHRHRNHINDYWKIVGGTILLNEILHHSHHH